MTGISFKSSLTNDLGEQNEVLIEFNYVMPEKEEERQDPWLGSIHLTRVIDATSFIPLPVLSINERINARRLCWEHLVKSRILPTQKPVL